MESVNREELLKQCESVGVAVSKNPTSDQSHCLGFANGKVFAFDGARNLLVSAPSGLNGFTGALRGDLLLSILRKLPDEQITLVGNKSSVSIKSSFDIDRVPYEEEVLIPAHVVEQPTDEWSPLHRDFCDASREVQRCCHHDAANNFSMSCVHATPKALESCNRYQAARWRLKTRLGGELLIPREGVRHLASLGVTEVQRTEQWLHFQNPSGVVLSCQWYDPKESVYAYPDLDSLFDWEGEPLALPRDLEGVIQMAEVFSSACGALKKADNFLLVKLSKKEMRVEGESVLGKMSKGVPAKYDGKPLTFTISPEILTHVVKKYSECFLRESDGTKPPRLKVRADGYEYVTTLGSPDNRLKRSEEGKDE